MRALKACGDGFWEFDLADGTVWFSDWFYRKLGWRGDAQRTTLKELKPLTSSTHWEALMRGFRDHLEQRLPLDIRVQVRLPGDRIEWWQIRGAAERNPTGQPTHLAGSAREFAGGGQQPEASALRCHCGAFAELPIAAVLLDGKGNVLQSNRKWSESPAELMPELLRRVKASPAPAPVEFTWDEEAAPGGTPRRVRVHAVPVEQPGLTGWVATLEDLALR